MVWCNGFSNGLVCISGKCSGMESGDGPRESLWETLTGVEQSLRTSTGDVLLLVWFRTDNMFVPWDYSVQQLESPITSSSADGQNFSLGRCYCIFETSEEESRSLQDEVMKDDKAISFLGAQNRSLSNVNSGQSEDEEVDGSVIREFQRHNSWQWPLPQPQKPRARCSC